MANETLLKIAQELVAGCREGREAEGLGKLYAEDAVSVEAAPMPGSDSAETKGLEGIRGKHAWWESAMEVHEATVDGPFLHGDDKFAVLFGMDVTDKQSGKRSKMREVALYTVKDEKIVREEFFYPY
ncbi:MAG: nuclear transport factor 2 family protein [Pseudomonadota bacterium]